MEAKTIIDEIAFEPPSGVTRIRMRKQVVDGDKVLASEYHRTSIDADGDGPAQIAAVNAHLAQLGFPAVTTEDAAMVSAIMSPLATHRAVKAVEKAAKAK